MANEGYRLAGSFGAGALSAVVKQKTASDTFGLLIAAGIAALGYLGSMSFRGPSSEAAIGALDGGIAYLGSWAGVKMAPAFGGGAQPVSFQAFGYEPVPQAIPASAGGGVSVLEI